MKLRSMIGFCALAIAAFGLESNTCGLMNVPSDIKCTMIAVPWLNVGGGNVKVCDLVKTDTLTSGTKLYYYNGSAFEVWELGGGGWSAVTTVGEVNGVTTAAAASDKTIARGQALWLERRNTTDEIWIYGQYTTDVAQVAVTKGSATAPAYTMIANPLATDFDLNSKNVQGATGDQISFPSDDGNGELYTFDGANWTRMTVVEKTIGGKERDVKTTTTEGCVIPAGKGVWYVSKGGNPVVCWN